MTVENNSNMTKSSGGFESWTLALSAFAESRQSTPSPLVNASSGPRVVATSAPDTRVHRDRKAAPSQYALWQPDERKPRQRQQQRQGQGQGQGQGQQRQKLKPSRTVPSHAEYVVDTPLKSQLPVRVLARSTRKDEDLSEKNADTAEPATGLAGSTLTEKQKAYLEARRQIFGD